MSCVPVPLRHDLLPLLVHRRAVLDALAYRGADLRIGKAKSRQWQDILDGEDRERVGCLGEGQAMPGFLEAYLRSAALADLQLKYHSVNTSLRFPALLDL